MIPLTPEEITEFHSCVTEMGDVPAPGDWDRLVLIAADHARLVEVVAEYEHNICWDTTCSGCAAVLDKTYEAYCDERHNELVAERDTLRAEVEQLREVVEQSRYFRKSGSFEFDLALDRYDANRKP